MAQVLLPPVSPYWTHFTGALDHPTDWANTVSDIGLYFFRFALGEQVDVQQHVYTIQSPYTVLRVLAFIFAVTVWSLFTLIGTAIHFWLAAEAHQLNYDGWQSFLVRPNAFIDMNIHADPPSYNLPARFDQLPEFSDMVITRNQAMDRAILAMPAPLMRGRDAEQHSIVLLKYFMNQPATNSHTTVVIAFFADRASQEVRETFSDRQFQPVGFSFVPANKRGLHMHLKAWMIEENVQKQLIDAGIHIADVAAIVVGYLDYTHESLLLMLSAP